MGGGTGSGSRGATRARGAAQEERTGAGRARDRHCGEGAQHHHSPGVPGEAARQEAQGPLQEEPSAQTGP